MKGRFRALVAHPQVEALGELAELLGSIGLQVETARSTVEALNKLRSHPAHVIVSQQVTGVFDGVGLLEASILHAPEALRIALVSSPDESVDLDYRPAHAGTIVRLVARPSERSRLVALVNEGVKLLSLVEEQRELVRKLSLEQTKLQRRETLLDTVVKERTKELEESYEQLKIANRQALFGLAEAIEAKDPYTKGHAAASPRTRSCSRRKPAIPSKASRRSSSARSCTTSARSASAMRCCSSPVRSTTPSGSTCASTR